MWILTPSNLAQAKIELKGRRAAIEARYAEELKAIDADLDEIETLERIAHSFSTKHLAGSDIVMSESEEGTREAAATEAEPNMPVSEPELEPLGTTAAGQEPETMKPQLAAQEADSPVTLPNAIAQLRPSPEEPPVSADTAPKGGSLRWRIRVPSDSKMA